MNNEKKLLQLALKTAFEAGQAILEVYDTDFDVAEKDDKSPVTKADTQADALIKKRLQDNSDYPILSEEGKDIAYQERQKWEQFWLVDPLDGTKEFIKRNGEFTVNIALVDNEKPVLGVIFVPAEGLFYFATQSKGSYKYQLEEKTTLPDLNQIIDQAQQLPLTERKNTSKVRVVASRSHINNPTQNFIDKLKEQYEEVKVVPKGSSLKLCLVAEGKADVYPRFGPTMEWDTAAGQAIAEYAQRQVLQHENGNTPLTYNKKELKNPWFIVQDKSL
jgi:3'(2'), 5'-bisphosphate nucleotidase